MTICKSWERQVLENTEAIKELQEGGVSDLPEQVSELNQQMERTLKIPSTSSPDTRLVGIGGANEQETIYIGNGLAIESGSLVATGGGGGGSSKLEYIAELTYEDQEFYLNSGDWLISLQCDSGYFATILAYSGMSTTLAAISPDIRMLGVDGYIEDYNGTCKLKFRNSAVWDYSTHPVTIRAKQI